MPANVTPYAGSDPWWDEPDDSAALRAKIEATEAHLLTRVAITGRRWQREMQRERARKRRGGVG
jgi:hypothetical protein